MVAVGVHQKLPDRTNDVESGIPLRQPLYNEHPYAPIYNIDHSQYNGAELNRASYTPTESSYECSRGEEEEEKLSDDNAQIICLIVVAVVIGFALLLVISYSNNGVSSGNSTSTHHSYGHGGSNYMIFHSSHSSSHRSSYHGSRFGGRRGGSRGGSRGGGGRRG